MSVYDPQVSVCIWQHHPSCSMRAQPSISIPISITIPIPVLQVTREMMFGELDYTLNTTETTLPGLHGMVSTAATALEAARGAHAIAIMTEWDEFVTTGKSSRVWIWREKGYMGRTSEYCV